MKGTVQSKTTKKGIEYLYIYLDYTDPVTRKRRQKVVSTGLTAKGNKRKAEAMIKSVIEKYQYIGSAPNKYRHQYSCHSM